MRAVLAGPDEDGLGAALAERGVEVRRVEGLATREKLLGAGIEGAAVFVLTSVEDASAVSVARDDNPGVSVVVYAPGTLPAFARGQVDLAVDPDLLDAGVVAEELAG